MGNGSLLLELSKCSRGLAAAVLLQRCQARRHFTSASQSLFVSVAVESFDRKKLTSSTLQTRRVEFSLVGASSLLALNENGLQLSWRITLHDQLCKRPHGF